MLGMQLFFYLFIFIFAENGACWFFNLFRFAHCLSLSMLSGALQVMELHCHITGPCM